MLNFNSIRTNAINKSLLVPAAIIALLFTFSFSAVVVRSDENNSDFTLKVVSFEEAGITVASSTTVGEQQRVQINLEPGTEPLGNPYATDGITIHEASSIKQTDWGLIATFDGLGEGSNQVEFPMVNLHASQDVRTTIGAGKFVINGIEEFRLGEVVLDDGSNNWTPVLRMFYYSDTVNSVIVDEATITANGETFYSRGPSVTYDGSGAVAEASIKFSPEAIEALSSPDSEFRVLGSMELVRAVGSFN